MKGKGASASSGPSGDAGPVAKPKAADPVTQAFVDYAGIHSLLQPCMLDFALSTLKAGSDVFFSIPMHKDSIHALASLLKALDEDAKTFESLCGSLGPRGDIQLPDADGSALGQEDGQKTSQLLDLIRRVAAWSGRAIAAAAHQAAKPFRQWIAGSAVKGASTMPKSGPG